VLVCVARHKRPTHTDYDSTHKYNLGREQRRSKTISCGLWLRMPPNISHITDWLLRTYIGHEVFSKVMAANNN